MGKQKYPQTSRTTTGEGAATGATVDRLGGYTNAILHAKRDKLAQEAQVRQREHDKLSTLEKIALAKSRRGESRKEIARLEKLFASAKAPAIKITTALLTSEQKDTKATERKSKAKVNREKKAGKGGKVYKPSQESVT